MIKKKHNKNDKPQKRSTTIAKNQKKVATEVVNNSPTHNQQLCNKYINTRPFKQDN